MNIDKITHNLPFFHGMRFSARDSAVLITLCCALAACSNDIASSGETAADSTNRAGQTGNIESAMRADSTAMASENPSQRSISERSIANPLAATAANKTAIASSSGIGAEQFLPVDDAFKLDVAADANATEVVWIVAPEYYLYKHKFKILAHFPGHDEAQDVTASARFSPGLHKTDDYFGRVEVFYNQAVASLPPLNGEQPRSLTVQYQGCADAGLCYPVQTRTLDLP